MKAGPGPVRLVLAERDALARQLGIAAEALEVVAEHLAVVTVREGTALSAGTQRLLEEARGGVSVLRARVACAPVVDA